MQKYACDPVTVKNILHGVNSSHRDSEVVKTVIGVTAGVTAGTVGTVVLAPAVLGLVGFTAGGISAGSIAAGMMSSAAVANGGGVAAGSLVAILQSVGAAGFTSATTVGVASTGGVIGSVLGWFSGRKGKSIKQ